MTRDTVRRIIENYTQDKLDKNVTFNKNNYHP